MIGASAAEGDWKAAYAPKTEAWKQVEQHFIFNNESEPETLDPAKMTGVLEDRIAKCLFEGLVTNDPKTLEPRPGVAERWEVSADGTTYTFHLRDCRWSDGVPLVAEHFRSAWLRVLAAATAADYAYMLYPIVGAEDFHAGKADAGSVGITASDPRTLVVRLRAPCPWFLDLCAFHTYLPTRDDVVAAHGERWTRAGNLVGNGPFALRSWDPRQSIVVERNPQYWDAGFVKLARITILPHDNAESAYKLFQSGAIHWMATLPLPKLDEIRQRADYYSAPYFGTYFYRFNTTKPPFDDVHVRRAVTWAIDRRAITGQITRGGQVPSGSFCPAVAGFAPIAGPGLDIDRARAELAKSRYAREGAGAMPPIELHYNTSEQHKQIAEAVAQQLKQALGVEVVLRNTEWKTYLQDQDRREYQMSRSSWIGDYGDPNTFFDLFVKDGGNNKTGWSDPRYDELVQVEQRELDPAKRQAAFHELERLLVEDGCPIACVYTYVAQGLLDERVMGWWNNIRDVHPLKYIWLEP